MRKLKFPVAVWEDFGGCYTAKTIDGEPAIAVDTTMAGALTQVRKFLQWRFRQEEFAEAPDMDHLRAVEFRVAVRPQYRARRTIYRSGGAILVRVFGVLGKRRSNLPVCSLPMLDMQYSSSAASDLDGLVRDALQRHLNGLEPHDMAKCLPPRRMTVETIHITVRPKADELGAPELFSLPQIAEPFSQRRAARRFVRAWRRDELVEKLTERLGRDTASFLLLGAGGVGKSTLLANAVRKLDRTGRAKKKGRETPADLVPEENATREPARRRYWLTSGARLIAGMQYLGQWEERCEAVIDELSEIGGVLCVENLLELTQAGSCEPNSSVAAFLAPYIERRELRLVGEATAEEFDACRRLLPGFASLFQVVRAPEFSDQEAQGVLRDMIDDRLRNRRDLEVDDTVAALAYSLFRRFLPYQSFPGRNARFVDELLEKTIERIPPPAPRRAMKPQTPGSPGGSRPAPTRLSDADVYQHFQKFSGLPKRLIREDAPLRHEEVLESLTKRVIGQPDACDAASLVVTRFKAGLHDPLRPLGVLLFCGPTGVGKTELARTLARYLFGANQGEDRLLRLDMSEYSGFGAAEQLMTRPDGRPSELVKRIRQQPFAVLLLDEIEKAADEVFDALLSVLDEGRLTDRFGRTATFRSAVIIMTSNLGASRSTPVGFGEPPPPYEKEVRSAFRPEFFNRIDSVVTFQSLSAETIREITVKELGDLSEREGFRAAGVRLEWEQTVVERIAVLGFDRRYGARPLQRVIERHVVAPLARWLVRHPLEENVTLCLSLDDSMEIHVDRLA